MNANKELARISERSLDHFIPKYVTDENREQMKDEGLGIDIAIFCEWDGIRIMKIFSAALEDANFHSEAAKVDEMIKETERYFEECSVKLASPGHTPEVVEAQATA